MFVLCDQLINQKYCPSIAKRIEFVKQTLERRRMKKIILNQKLDWIYVWDLKTRGNSFDRNEITTLNGNHKPWDKNRILCVIYVRCVIRCIYLLTYHHLILFIHCYIGAQISYRIQIRHPSYFSCTVPSHASSIRIDSIYRLKQVQFYFENTNPLPSIDRTTLWS